MFGTSSGEHALRDGPSLPLGALAREGSGSFELVEIFQMRWVPRRFTGLSKSMWRGRGPGAGSFVRDLGPFPLCLVLLVPANRKDVPDRCLGPAAESTPWGWAVFAAGHRGPAGCGSLEGGEIFQMHGLGGPQFRRGGVRSLFGTTAFVASRFTPVCRS